MRCLTPFALNTGLIVPCGRCYACRANKRSQWVFRLQQELKALPRALFVTLTYNDENLPQKLYDKTHLYRYNVNGNYATLEKEHISKFIRGMQRVLKKDSLPLMRYMITGEYGDQTKRPHYHGLLFFSDKLSEEEAKVIISLVWCRGNVDFQSVSPANINYLAKHQTKDCKGNEYQNKFAPIFCIMSRYNGGLGKDYLTPINIAFHRSNKHSNAFVVLNNRKVALPQFYRKKLWPDLLSNEEMEILIQQSRDTYFRESKALGFAVSDKYGKTDSKEYYEFRQKVNREKWRRYFRLRYTRKYVKSLNKKSDV